MITFSDVKKAFDNTTVVDIKNLEIHEETSTALIGSNGAGKSTVLLLLVGLSTPTSGTIRIDGLVPGSKLARKKVSFAPDQPALFDDLTLADQLTYVARLSNQNEPTKTCLDLIDAFDADDLLEKFPRSMSKGQRQKASLLVSTARPFEILLLDEPTSGLDDASQQALVQVLQELSSTGKTVICSSHNPEVIDSANYQILLEDGLAEYLPAT